MSASPAKFPRIPKPRVPKSNPLSRVTELDESVVQSPVVEESRNAEASDQTQEAVSTKSSSTFLQSRSLHFYSWMLLSLVGGIVAGRLLFVLWEHVAAHDQQLARHQAEIQNLAKTQTTVTDQENQLRALNTNVGSIQALLDAQSQRLANLERGQAETRDQMSGMNARWQKQINELSRDKALIANAAAAKTSAPTTGKDTAAAAVNAPAAPALTAAEKHNETFSPDLKPTPNAYAQMLPSGLVVWMTPRPGFAKPVPTSVIGQVHGLGMLVHNWQDNKHYFITESGSWLADQR